MSYGKTLLRIRQSKNMTLKEACGETLSPSQLSRFEKEKTSLRVDDFHSVLLNLNTTPAEFHYLNQTEQLYSRELFETMRVVDEAKHLDEIDYEGLRKQFREKAKPYNWEYFFLYFYEYVEKLKEKEEIKPTPILDYLMQVEDWGEMEIRLFSMFLFTFKMETIHSFMKTALKRSEAYQSISETKRVLYMLLLNTFSIFLRENKLDYAREVLHRFDHEFASEIKDMDIHAHFLFNHGLLAFKENRLEQAKEYCEQAISWCEGMKQKELADLLKRRYQSWQEDPQLNETFIQVGWPDGPI